jgi:hypothetical protein
MAGKEVRYEGKIAGDSMEEWGKSGCTTRNLAVRKVQESCRPPLLPGIIVGILIGSLSSARAMTNCPANRLAEDRTAPQFRQTALRRMDGTCTLLFNALSFLNSSKFVIELVEGPLRCVKSNLGFACLSDSKALCSSGSLQSVTCFFLLILPREGPVFYWHTAK